MTTSYKLQAVKELKAQKKLDRIREAEELKAKQEQRAQEKLLDANLQERRLDVQKTIANDKLKVAIDRLKQNADLKLIELEKKFKGNK